VSRSIGVTPEVRVLHVDTERGWRGGQRQVLWLAEGLTKRGIHSVLAARPGEPLAERAARTGVRVIPCSPFAEFDPFAVRTLRRAMEYERVNIVHAHTAHAVALAALATLGTPVHMVVTRRVSHPPKANLGTRWKYGRAHAVIAVASASARALAASGVSKVPIRVVPSGVDLSRRIPHASPETLAALGVTEGAPLVVMVAALTAEKDPITFVRAIAHARRLAPSIRAILVGDGPLRPDVERAIADAGLDDAVRLAGFREDADAFLAVAQVVVSSSTMEGTSGVILDALSLAKPVVATSAGGTAEVLQEDRSGYLVPVGDAAAMGARIAELLLDPARAARIGEGGRHRAADYSIERTVDRTLEIYVRVLSRSP
jgi:glycosyltransferase involved in cell wall biosynthesis